MGNARRFSAFLVIVSAVMVSRPSPLEAQSALEKTLSSGETVYVSVYSNVYAGPKEVPFQLSAIVSIRNTDPAYGITILNADYYDTNGTLLERYLKKPVQLKPLASKAISIKEYDTRGGVGANFLVTWKAEKMLNQPIIESIMLGLSRNQGISFVCPGQILIRHGK